MTEDAIINILFWKDSGEERKKERQATETLDQFYVAKASMKDLPVNESYWRTGWKRSERLHEDQSQVEERKTEENMPDRPMTKAMVY